MSTVFSMGVIFGIMVMNPFVDAAVDAIIRRGKIKKRAGIGFAHSENIGIDQGFDNYPNESNTIDITNYVIVIGVILAILLLLNLVLCLKNLFVSDRTKRKQYYPVKYDTSDFGTESADEALNIDVDAV